MKRPHGPSDWTSQRVSDSIKVDIDELRVKYPQAYANHLSPTRYDTRKAIAGLSRSNTYVFHPVRIPPYGLLLNGYDYNNPVVGDRYP